MERTTHDRQRYKLTTAAPSGVRSLMGAMTALLLLAGEADAQLAVDDTLTPEELVNILLGPDSGIAVSNVSLTGDPRCIGAFTGGAELGVNEGIVVSSGQVVDSVGPNLSDGTTTDFGMPGDSFLDTLVVPPAGSDPPPTFDACVLEFDFECTEGSIGDAASFQYVFTSEEYNEFTNSAFTNVFGFALNGANIALLPDGTPVEINTVNGGSSPFECSNGFDDDADGLIDAIDPDCFTPLDNIVGENNANSDLFRNNDCDDPDGGSACPINIEADGLTVVLGAEGAINDPGVNTIRLAIGDVADAILDSWVFLEAGSFKCQPLAFLDVDIKPTSCPNPFKLGKAGVVPAAILGSDTLDVADIDPTTVELNGPGGTAAPLRWSVEDVAAPDEFPEPELRDDCGTDGPDGFDDLTLKFDAAEVEEALGPVSEGDVVILTISAETTEGASISGVDAVWIRGDSEGNVEDSAQASEATTITPPLHCSAAPIRESNAPLFLLLGLVGLAIRRLRLN